MDNNITAKAFAFENHPVRTKYCDNRIWFVARDVAQALKYSESSMESMARLTQAVPPEWVDLKPIQVNNREQRMHCLTEEGLYFFLGRSDKPKALPFQKWVYGEVLPQIRKTGAYAVQEKPEHALLKLLQGQEFKLYIGYEGKIHCTVHERKSPYDGLAKAIADPSNIGLKDEVIREIGLACTEALAYRARAAWRRPQEDAPTADGT